MEPHNRIREIRHSELCEAVRNDDLESFGALLREDENLINTVVAITDGEEELYPLHYVALQGKAQFVEHILLIEKQKGEGGGLVLTQESNAENTAIEIACVEGHLEVVRVFLEAELNPRLDNSANMETEGWRYNEKVFFAAVANDQTDIVRMFLERRREHNLDLDINRKNSWGDTPLILACYSGSLENIKLLIAAGADVNLEGKLGRTAFLSAVRGGNKEIIEFFLEHKEELGLDIYCKTKDGSDVIMVASEGKNLDILELLLDKEKKYNLDFNINQQNVEGITPLMLACKYGYLENVKLLIAAGAEVNLENEMGKTALFYAVEFDQNDVVKFLLEKKEDLGLKIDHRAIHNDYYTRDEIKTQTLGVTPLIMACKVGSVENVKHLIAAGADVNLEDENGNTALFHAVKSGNIDVVEFLLEQKEKIGLEINHQNKEGNTALIMACAEDVGLGAYLAGNKEMVGLLLEAGADFNMLQREGRNKALACALNRRDYGSIKLLLSEDKIVFDELSQKLIFKEVCEYNLKEIAELLFDRLNHANASFRTAQSDHLGISNFFLINGISTLVRTDSGDYQQLKIYNSPNFPANSVSSESSFDELFSFLAENKINAQPFTQIEDLSQSSLSFYKNNPDIFRKIYNYDKIVSTVEGNARTEGGIEESFLNLVYGLAHDPEDSQIKKAEDFKKRFGAEKGKLIEELREQEAPNIVEKLETSSVEDLKDFTSMGCQNENLKALSLVNMTASFKQQEIACLREKRDNEDFLGLIQVLDLVVQSFPEISLTNKMQNMTLLGIGSKAQEARLELINDVVAHHVKKEWSVLRRDLSEEVVNKMVRSFAEQHQNNEVNQDQKEVGNLKPEGTVHTLSGQKLDISAMEHGRERNR